MLGIFAWQNFISLSLNVTISFKITKLGVFDASLPCSLLLVCNKYSLLILKKKDTVDSQQNRSWLDPN